MEKSVCDRGMKLSENVREEWGGEGRESEENFTKLIYIVPPRKLKDASSIYIHIFVSKTTKEIVYRAENLPE